MTTIMTTTDHTLLVILTVLLSAFFAFLIVLTILLIQISSGVKRVVAKAGEVADSVEVAAEVLRDTSGRLALFKIIRNIIKLSQKGKK